MKIAQIAPFTEPVPPKKYGGSELIVSLLTEELVKRNHTVYLFADGQSRTTANLVSIFPKSLRRAHEIKNKKQKDIMKWIGVDRVIKKLKEIEGIEIIHNHLTWRFLYFVDFLKPKIITTLHGPLTDKKTKPVYDEFCNANYVSISNAQRKPNKKLNYIATIYNGTEIKNFDFCKNPKPYLVLLGRISPEKGIVKAIEIAKKSKLPLKIAAKIDIVDKKYFNNKVKPLIDNKNIIFLGEIGHKEKVRLLKKAKAMLLPIQWEEPFGLVMTEAMACGTPVIVFDRGSAREVVKNGKTGFVVKNVKEAVEAIKKINTIKREDCRKWVEEKFTVEKMVDGYEKVYYRIIKNQKHEKKKA